VEEAREGSSKSVTRPEKETWGERGGGRGGGGRSEGSEDISRCALDPFGINLGLIEFEANTERGAARGVPGQTLAVPRAWINTVADRRQHDRQNLRY